MPRDGPDLMIYCFLLVSTWFALIWTRSSEYDKLRNLDADAAGRTWSTFLVVILCLFHACVLVIKFDVDKSSEYDNLRNLDADAAGRNWSTFMLVILCFHDCVLVIKFDVDKAIQLR